MIVASGCCRRARRIAWRAWRSASAVTPQVLTMTAPPRPAAAAARRMTSDSNALSRQPKVMISISGMTPSARREQARVEGTLKAQCCPPGHDHMPVLAPRDVESAAVELDGCAAPGQSPAMRRDEGCTGAAAAGASDPGPAFPHPQTDIPALPDRRDADVRALGKQRVVLEDRPERREIDRFYVGDEEGRVRVADVGADRCGERTERQ